MVAGILKYQYKMGIIHNLSEECVDVQIFLNTLARKNVLCEIAYSCGNMKPHDPVHSWQNLPSGLKMRYMTSVCKLCCMTQ
jgi:hypothetical protein